MAKNPAKRIYLPRLIEKTRKAHIEAEKRLLRYDQLAKRANVYYACLTVLLSLLSFCFPEHRLIAFLAIAVAITLTVVAVFASMQDFGMRAAQMRYSYLALQDLQLEFDDVLTNQTRKEHADIIGRKYVDVLHWTENHTEEDYVRVLALEHMCPSICLDDDAELVSPDGDSPDKDSKRDKSKKTNKEKNANSEVGKVSHRIEAMVYGFPWLLMVLLSGIYCVLNNVSI